MGIPHGRGYLLHGEPGNGKTSLIKAIASHYDRCIYYLSLSDEKMTDASLFYLIGGIEAKYPILVLEDVDCLFQNNRDSKNKITMSGLLNSLDGLMSVNNLILFMTTNHIDRLDPALIRPGRIDKKFYIGNATQQQAYDYYINFYGKEHEKSAEQFSCNLTERKYSMCELQQKFIENPYPILSMD